MTRDFVGRFSRSDQWIAKRNLLTQQQRTLAINLRTPISDDAECLRVHGEYATGSNNHMIDVCRKAARLIHEIVEGYIVLVAESSQASH